MKIIGAFTIIHQGYLKVLEKHPKAEVLIISNKFRDKLISLEIDIRKVEPKKIKKMLESIDREAKIISEADFKKLIKQQEELLVIEEEITKNLIEKYLKDYPKLKTETGFLYHKKEDVQSAKKEIKESNDYSKKDLKYLQKAVSASKKAGCWWRQVGSVLVKDGKVLYRASNEMMPSENECYKIGCVRDHIKPGEKTEVCSAIHSEAQIIARAAKDGQSLKGAKLYVTTFPCTVCAKLIAKSGIDKVFYFEGWSNFDGERVLKAAGVDMIQINLKENG